MTNLSGQRSKFAAELLGTYFLVLFGAGSVVVAPLIGFQLFIEAIAFIALVFSATVATMILLIGNRSGSHINPAITLACAISGGFRRDLLVPYAAFQIAGGLLAGLTLKLALGSVASSAALGSSMLAPGLDPAVGTALEATGTFILAASALYASSFVRSPARQASIVGATLFVLIVLLAPLTGASFNPARSLGPSVFAPYYTNQLVYWTGPPVGAACAGILFARLRRAQPS